MAKANDTNPMKSVKIEKLTLNIGAGKDQKKLEKAVRLIKNIVGVDPVKTVTQKRIPTWGLRPGLPIGCKITLRGDKAEEVFLKLVKAKDSILSLKQIDDFGNVAFGIHEYIDIPGVNYDPEIGIMGLQVCLTLERNGHRIKRRRHLKRRLPMRQNISKEESAAFLKQSFSIRIKEEQAE
ncbi:50S ribosomal protein L5 [Candidatus Woesearchaeota archaeon]|nr:50S ribosomal protein L5 [Candidatus Woesearchaeota archaeon]